MQPNTDTASASAHSTAVGWSKAATGEEPTERSSREGVRERLQCSHVVEGQVQLFAEGLALQLLSVHFIWRMHRERADRHTEWEEEENEKRIETDQL